MERRGNVVPARSRDRLDDGVGDQMKKRLFAVALTALIPATGMLVYNEFWYRAQRDREIHEQALQASRQVASEVDRIFEGIKSLLIATSAIPSVTGDDTLRCNSVLAGIAAEVPWVATISMVTPEGMVLCSSMPDRNGADIADRDYFRQALETGEFATGGFTRGRLSQTDVLPVAKAVRRAGLLRGVLVAGLKLDWFQARVQERGTLPDGIISITDADGVVVVRTPMLPGVVGTKIASEFMHLLRQPRPGILEARSRDGVMRVFGYQPPTEERPFYIAAGFSKDAAFEQVNRGTLTATFLIVLSVAIAAVAAIFIGNRFITRPISRIVAVIDRWAGGDLDARTRMRGRYGEIGRVGASVDGLLEELDRRRLQTEEAEAARALLARELSHRVKNTLSVVQAIARQTFGKIVPQQAIDSYTIRVRALAGTYDTLLAEEWESADIRTVVERAVAPHHDPEDGRFRLDGPEFPLPPKAVLAVSLILHELATNAAKYGALSTNRGHIEIRWHRTDARIGLDWSEHGGPPVAPPEREGFGTKVVSRAFDADFAPEVDFDYRPDGLHFHLSFLSEAPPAA